MKCWTCVLAVAAVSLSIGACRKSAPTGESQNSKEFPQTSDVAEGVTQSRAIDSGYAALAESLADPFLLDPNQQYLTKELPQLLAEANVKIVGWQSLESDDPLMRKTAQEAAEAGITMLQSQQVLLAMQHDAGLTELATMAFGLFTSDPTVVFTGASGLLAKGVSLEQERLRFAAALNRARAAQLMLPAAAKKYAGPKLSSGNLIHVDFDESFAGSANHDRIALTNASGRQLTRCTVLVELRGRSGEVRQNVHYVETWNPQTTLYARYGIGIESDSGVYGRRTAYGVQEIRLSVWADQGKQEDIRYEYRGAERERDIRSLLDDKLIVRYRYDGNGLFGGKSVLLVLEGVPMLPAHSVTLYFYKGKGDDGEQPLGWVWQQPEWHVAESRTFNLSTSLTFDPGTMQIVVGFPDSAYVYRRTVHP